ncbi:MAG: hypothetical protein F7C34_01385 [Desulfurococcales archaeon]|nr:hypothetical protein [Desulfurococcales archaeon]
MEGVAGVERYKLLMSQGRFYEAHVTAEEIMRLVNRRVGKCLAVYAALALKVNEALPRAVDHLLRLLERDGCHDIIYMDCARSIARSMGRKVEGESLACLLPL